MSMSAELNSLSKNYASAEDVNNIIKQSAAAAAAASVAGTLIPGIAIPALIVECVGAVWVMYFRLCDCLGFHISKNTAKALASAALSNIAANLAGVFAAEFIGLLIPGLSIPAGIAATYATVYLAGLVFVKMVNHFAAKGIVGNELDNMSEDAFKEVLVKQAVDRNDVREGKASYNATC